MGAGGRFNINVEKVGPQARYEATTTTTPTTPTATPTTAATQRFNISV